MRLKLLTITLLFIFVNLSVEIKAQQENQSQYDESSLVLINNFNSKTIEIKSGEKIKLFLIQGEHKHKLKGRFIKIEDSKVFIEKKGQIDSFSIYSIKKIKTFRAKRSALPGAIISGIGIVAYATAGASFIGMLSWSGNDNAGMFAGYATGAVLLGAVMHTAGNTMQLKSFNLKYWCIQQSKQSVDPVH
ncbi:MAG: hypothetical protein CL663_03620 [Bacteroidetes bacterium]|nr:hypothetical protein [Bacteroidota bacterium]